MALVENVVISIRKHSLLSQSLLAALILGALLSLLSPFRSAFSLTAGQLVNVELWRLLTHSLVESNPLVLLWSLFCIHQVALLIEPVWGSWELAKYLALVQVLSALFWVLFALFCYVAFSSVDFMYHISIHGLLAADAGVFVAVKQFVPDSILLTTPFGRLKNTHLPMSALLISGILSLLGAVRPVASWQIAVGMQIAWTYLRFYQPHGNGENNATCGDVSEHFTWASFLQPFASLLSNPLYSLLLRLRVCKPSIRQVDFAQLNSVTVVLPDAETQDAERRRKKALRDLTERLNRASQAETSAWPNMDDEDAPSMSPHSPIATPHNVLGGETHGPMKKAQVIRQGQAKGEERSLQLTFGDPHVDDDAHTAISSASDPASSARAVL